MKIIDIVETIDQKEADEVLKSLVASGDPAAPYFQKTRYDPRHSTIDSAQRAAERMWSSEQRRKKSADDRPSADSTPAKFVDMPKQAEPGKKEPKPNNASDWDDRFYGNQHTGSLGKSVSDILNVDFDQQGLKTIGKGVKIAKTVAKPISAIAKAFKAGINAAPTRR